MKSTHFMYFSLVTLTLLGMHALSAEAREKTGRKQVLRDESTLEYSQSAPESTYTTSRATRFAVGFSTISSTIPGATAAITGVVDFDRYNALQAFFSIPQTSPFNIGGAVLYKRTISESRGAGFHVGGGLGLANVNGGGLGGAAFALNLSAVGGFHFEMPGISHVMVHLDGGPTFNLINTSPSTTTNFQVGALSPALGASVVYIF
jgi:hypothetical protein